MKTALFALAFVLLAPVALRAAEPSHVWKLWPDGAPDGFTVPGPETAQPPKPTDKAPILRLTNIAEPRLEIYEPAEGKANGGAVVIVPGGGFGILAAGHEGAELAEWFRERGFVAGVLIHRCPTNTLPKPWEFPAHDAQRAVSLLRAKSGELGIRGNRVGLFGFSAGGQVALIAATNARERLQPVGDAIDQTSCRPDFLMLCYPWKILADGSLTDLRPEIPIAPGAPATFIAQAADDKGSLAEGSIAAFLALRKAGVPAELHLYATGGHGFGLRPSEHPAPGDWPGRLEGWLVASGLMDKPERP